MAALPNLLNISKNTEQGRNKMRFVQSLVALAFAAIAVSTPIAHTGTTAHAEMAGAAAVVLQDDSNDGGNWDDG